MAGAVGGGGDACCAVGKKQPIAVATIISPNDVILVVADWVVDVLFCTHKPGDNKEDREGGCLVVS